MPEKDYIKKTKELLDKFQQNPIFENYQRIVLCQADLINKQFEAKTVVARKKFEKLRDEQDRLVEAVFKQYPKKIKQMQSTWAATSLRASPSRGMRHRNVKLYVSLAETRIRNRQIVFSKVIKNRYFKNLRNGFNVVGPEMKIGKNYKWYLKTSVSDLIKYDGSDESVAPKSNKDHGSSLDSPVLKYGSEKKVWTKPSQDKLALRKESSSLYNGKIAVI